MGSELDFKNSNLSAFNGFWPPAIFMNSIVIFLFA